MKPHKWAKEIKAWADGAEVEHRWKSEINFAWYKCTSPIEWDNESIEYRIKPQEQQSSCCCKQTCSAPKESQYLYVYDEGRIVLGWDKHECKSYMGKIKLEE